MELNFIENENQDWVAEFEATGDFNLHLERDLKGTIIILLKQNEEDEYAFSSEFPNYYKIFNYDFAALLYPKYIKVISDSKVIKGSVNFNEGGGSGSGSGSELKWEYYKIDWSDENLINILENELDESQFRDIIIGASQFVNYTGEFDINHIASSTKYVLNGYVQENNIRVNKIAAYPFAIYDGYTMIDNGNWIENLKAINSWMYQEPTWFKPITKEQFYNLEA